MLPGLNPIQKFPGNLLILNLGNSKHYQGSQFFVKNYDFQKFFVIFFSNMFFRVLYLGLKVGMLLNLVFDKTRLPVPTQVLSRITQVPEVPYNSYSSQHFATKMRKSSSPFQLDEYVLRKLDSFDKTKPFKIQCWS